MTRRWLLLALIVGLLTGGVTYDRLQHVAAGTAAAPVVRPVNPSVTDPARLSSVWYCPVGSAGGGYAEHTVEVANVGEGPAVATVSVLTDEGPGPSIRVELDPGARRDVALAQLETAAVAGAVVEVLSGQGVVDHVVATPHGLVRGACATSASEEWHFAGGVTTRDATYHLALLNPFPEDAVVDVRFQAADRARLPSELQGAIIPARSVRVIDVDASVAREGAVATTVVLRRGRVVAERLQSFDGVLGPVGSALELGSSGGTSETWFPAGQVSAAGDQRLVLYNPGATVAEVDVDLVPQDPDLSATYGLVPIEVSVAAGQFEVVDLKATATQLGVPLPLELGVHVAAVNDVPIVAERWSVSPPVDPNAIGADVAGPEGTAPDDGGVATTTPAPAPDPTTPTTAAPTPDSSPPTTVAPLPDAGAAPDEAATPPAGGLPATPTAPTGVVIDRGLATPARAWLLPATPLSRPDGTVLVVMGVDPDTTVTVRSVGEADPAAPPMHSVVISGGQRLVLPVQSNVALTDLVVTATGRVVVASSAVDADGSVRIANGIPVVGATAAGAGR